LVSAPLDAWRQGRLGDRALWLLPIGIALWANLHGGFTVGLVMIDAFLAADVGLWLGGSDEAANAARRRLRILGPTAGLSLAAVCLHPTGLGALAHVVSFLSGSRYILDHTLEFQSPNFHEEHLRPFLILLLASLVGLGWSRRRLALHEGLLLAPFAYFALYSTRNVALFAIVAAPIVADLVAALPMPGGRLTGAS